MSGSTVTLDDILRAAQARAASLVPETSGYLALAIADAGAQLPFFISDRAVKLDEDGAVRVGRSPHVVTPIETARRLREILADLLEVSAGSAPGLAQASRPRRDAERGADAFIRELEAALIPVNRAAARRALARLARETLRAKEIGRLKKRKRKLAPPAHAQVYDAPARSAPPASSPPRGRARRPAARPVHPEAHAPLAASTPAPEPVEMPLEVAVEVPVELSDTPPEATPTIFEDVETRLADVAPAPAAPPCDPFENLGDDLADATILDAGTAPVEPARPDSAAPSFRASPVVDQAADDDDDDDETTERDAEESGAPLVLRPRKARPGRRLKTAELAPGHMSSVDTLLNAFARGVQRGHDTQAIRTSLKLMVGLDPTTPPPPVIIEPPTIPLPRDIAAPAEVAILEAPLGRPHRTLLVAAMAAGIALLLGATIAWFARDAFAVPAQIEQPKPAVAQGQPAPPQP